jgi:hypothetical protein
MNDDQIKNAIEAIQSRLYSATSPAELAKLGMAASGLLSFTNSPEIENRVKAIQADVEKRIEEVESSISSQNISSNEREGRDDQDKTKTLDDLAAISDKIYEKFLLTHEKDLANNKKDNEKLGEALEAIQAGKELSEDQKKDVVKTPDQIQVELEQNHQREEAEERAKEEVKIRAAEIERLTRERDKLPLDQRGDIQAQIEQQVGRQEKALSVIGAAREHDMEYLKKAERVYNIGVAAKKSGTNQEVAHEITEQFVGRITDAQVERAAKQASQGGNAELAEWLQSAQAQKKVMQDPEVAKAAAVFANAVRKALEAQQPEHGQYGKEVSSGQLHPSPTPIVNTTSPNKGHGGPGT